MITLYGAIITEAQASDMIRSSDWIEVERCHENNGTYVKLDEVAIFVSTSTVIKGEWLYYSSSVKNWVDSVRD